MFGVGLEEFIAIIMVALIVLGPERLPIAMRTVGRWVRQLRDMSPEFRKEFAEEFAFIQEEMSELRKEAMPPAASWRRFGANSVRRSSQPPTT